MAVNNMTFEQAASVLNELHSQVTGKTGTAPVTTGDFVSVATETLKSGYDPVLNALTQMIGRTIFSVRPYRRKFQGLEVDAQKWGSITRKLAIVDKDFEDALRFELVDGLAVDMFNYGVKKLIGSYAAAMGGVDAIIFTAGVGENSASQRMAIASDLEFMGVKMDAEANNVRGKEVVISAADSKVKVLLIPTNEELMIAMDTAAIVKG